MSSEAPSETPSEELSPPTPTMSDASATTTADSTSSEARSEPAEVAAPAPIEAPTHDEQPAAGPSVEEVARIVATAVAEAQAIEFDDPEAASMPAPEPISGAGLAVEQALTPQQQTMLDPAAAAFEAARIAGEIVGDIESRSGAAIVAAAAAGAAIEAARARRAAGIGGDAPAPTGATEAAAAAAAAAGAASSSAAGQPGFEPNDPVVTVRMQRDRILRALAEDIAANTAETPAEVRPGGRIGHARATGQGRAVSAPGIETEAASATASTAAGAAIANVPATGEELEEDDLDPVQVAAAAIRRMRQRASTDFAELRGHYHRHDIVVLVVAFVIIVVAGRIHDRLVTPPTVKFDKHGLTFRYAQAWSPLEPMQPTPSRIMRDPSGLPPKAESTYHVAMKSSLDPAARIEIRIDKKPAWRNVVTGLELDRRNRWGELYSLDDSSVRAIEAQNWLRTVYRFAHATTKGDVPRVDRAIEYATEDRDQLYVITIFGTDSELQRIESVVAPTLRVATKTGLPLVPQTRSLAQKKQPNPVAQAFPSTVMIVVADMIDGKLRARGGASGVIVGKDGSILTNYHVIHEKDGRLHDAFVIGRYGARNRAPQLVCAGRPSRSKLQPELDLALIKCDTDLDGRTWTPPRETVNEARNADVRMGQKVWVLGYPDVGGGGLTISQGEVSGWTGLDGTAGRDFIKTDASISRGNSGGPVLDDEGKLVGIASASRTKVLANGSIIEVSQIGLVRPIATADCLTSIATIGWTPRENSSDCELQPSAVEAPAEGVRIESRVVDQATKAPIRDALVMVFRPGIGEIAIDVNRLDDQVLAWGRSISSGDVELKQPVPVPGRYTVMVVARGYKPQIGNGTLRLDDKTPPTYNPWGELKLSKN
jgi:S1-C subfamily serine protease